MNRKYPIERTNSNFENISEIKKSTLNQSKTPKITPRKNNTLFGHEILGLHIENNNVDFSSDKNDFLQTNSIDEVDNDAKTIQRLKTRRDIFISNAPQKTKEELEIHLRYSSSSSSTDEMNENDLNDLNNIQIVPKISKSSTSIPHEPEVSEIPRKDYEFNSKKSRQSNLRKTINFDNIKILSPFKNTQHNETQILSGINSLKQGSVNKKRKRGGWSRRYFILEPQKLFIFKNKSSVKKPKNTIILAFSHCKLSNNLQNKDQKMFSFEVFTPEKKYIFGTISQSETQDWVKNIQSLCENRNLEFISNTEDSVDISSLDNQIKLRQELNFIKASDQGNMICCDCESNNPEWTVFNFGIFVCIGCSGIHRSLGVHISKVKSIELDKWEDNQVEMIRQMGNTKFNMTWEYSIPPYRKKPKLDSTLEERKIWILSKYLKRSFFDHLKIDKYPEPDINSSQKLDELEILKFSILDLAYNDKEFRKYLKQALSLNEEGMIRKEDSTKKPKLSKREKIELKRNTQG